MVIEVDLETGVIDIVDCEKYRTSVVSKFMLNEVDEETMESVVSELEDLLRHLNVEYNTIYF